MLPQIIPESNYLIRMADGTIKQVNPFTGTEVWTCLLYTSRCV